MTPTQPGQLVSAGQHISPAPRLIYQIRGIPEKNCYKYATLFVDHNSRFTYMHLHKTDTSYENIEGKISFERMFTQYGFQVEAYNAKNGIFIENKWICECEHQGKRLMFVGVNDHYKNGIS